MQKVFLIIYIMALPLVVGSCAEGKAKDDFIKNFDLQLRGEVLSVNENRYGQYLVCLRVLYSNYKNYFPIHDPNKYIGNPNLYEKRFFIKVQDSIAVMILMNDKVSRVIHSKIKKGSISEINLDGKKGYEFYDKGNSKKGEKIKYILTSPIRDNIENSCLNR